MIVLKKRKKKKTFQTKLNWFAGLTTWLSWSPKVSKFPLKPATRPEYQRSLVLKLFLQQGSM